MAGDSEVKGECIIDWRSKAFNVAIETCNATPFWMIKPLLIKYLASTCL